MKEKDGIVLLSFDACDIDIVRRLAADEKLPTFRRLLHGWASAKIRNPHGFFVGTVWTSFATARSASKIGFHCWETITPSYEYRQMSPLEVVGRPFWRALGESGRKVAVLDMPHSRSADGIDCLEVSEYGAHDRHFGLRTSPQALRDEIVSRFGFHPVLTVDPYAEKHFAADDYVHRGGMLRTAEEEGLLLKDLLDGLQRKLRLTNWVYKQNDWDLFISIFGESHAVGHQSWYLHDPAHPRHNSTLLHEIGDPVEKVYTALDHALADLLGHFSLDSTVFVLLSHGMQAHYDGTYILEPALARFDAAHRLGMRGSLTSRFIKSSWLRLNEHSRRYLAPPLMTAVRRHVRAHPPTPYFEADIGPSVRSRQRFFMSPNNSVYGGVRINLKGRESSGLVSPGREFDALCEQLKQDLLSLVNVDTGDRVIRSVERTDAYYERETVDELPDLLINWNHKAPVETVWSPKTGVIHAPYWHWRTGDHRPGGMLFVKGPKVPTGAALGLIENRDLGPTICAMLGVELTNIDGHPMPALV